MVRLALAAAATVLALVLPASAATSTRTALTVTYWAKGPQAGERVVWTLRCNPARGTLPHPSLACARLARGGPKLFAPVPKGLVCTQIYGGPQVARVVGILEGRRVRARFSRVDGCQIARWNRLSPWLLPAAGVSS
jgi:hypothetical protein